jgi:hypothetical protein
VEIPRAVTGDQDASSLDQLVEVQPRRPVRAAGVVRDVEADRPELLAKGLLRCAGVDSAQTTEETSDFRGLRLSEAIAALHDE